MAKSLPLIAPVVATLVGFVTLAAVFFPLTLCIVGALVLYHYVFTPWYRPMPTEDAIKKEAADKPVLITGCDTGFGEMLATQLDALGYPVIALCLTSDGVNNLKKKCSSKIVPVQGNVVKSDDIDKLAALVKSKFPRGIWTVVNNAGLARGHYAEISSMDNFLETMDVNFFGMVRVSKAFTDHLRPNQGRIVNITSIAGVSPCPGMPTYCASKFAAEGFTNTLRIELDVFGIRVINVQPGFMKTQIVSGATTHLERAFSAASEETRALYGGQQWQQEVCKNIEQFNGLAGNPQEVIDVLKHAIISPNPKNRYFVGKDAWIMWVWMSKMPDWFIQGCMELVSKDIGNLRDSAKAHAKKD
eukprot:GFYU01015380.1.p1 GENE.GFYU01015380.1~~GFYU01015380.1.p1  ORF type:complete len:358 (-),score=109.18 GFYU01015380.1:186-1259(-)